MQNFVEFMKNAGEAEKRLKISRKPLMQLLYLHRLISPFLELLSKNENFIKSTIGKNGLIYTIVHSSVQESDIKSINAIEIQLGNIIRYAEKFYDDLASFRKKSASYLKELGLTGIMHESDNILKNFLEKYKSMPDVFRAFLSLLYKIKNCMKKADIMKFEDKMNILSLCKIMNDTYLNPELWIKNTLNLQQQFYMKNGIISRESGLLQRALADQELINKYIINKDNYKQFLIDGDVLMSFKLYDYIKKDFFTKIVNKVTGSAVTHAGVYCNGLVAEARQKGSSVQWNDLHTAKNEIIIVLRTDLSEDQRRMIVERVRFYCPEGNMKPKYGYNWTGLLLHPVARRFKWLSRYIPKGKTFFCSELVAQIFMDIGIQLTPFSDPALVTPKDILESKKLFFVYVLDATRTFMNKDQEKKDFQDMLSQAKKLLDEKMIGVQY